MVSGVFQDLFDLKGLIRMCCKVPLRLCVSIWVENHALNDCVFLPLLANCMRFFDTMGSKILKNFNDQIIASLP